MKDDYNRRYYQLTKEYQLAKRKARYDSDPDYKERCKDRDRKRYHYRASWGGLLNIDPKLFLN